jgi:holin-like protein
MIMGFLVLLVCQLAGEVIARFLGLTVPGSVLGMLILFMALIIRRGVPAPLEQASSAILKPLVLYFVPASVGIMTMGPLLAQEGVRIIIVLILSTLLPLLLCGYGLDAWLSRKGAK